VKPIHHGSKTEAVIIVYAISRAALMTTATKELDNRIPTEVHLVLGTSVPREVATAEEFSQFTTESLILNLSEATLTLRSFIFGNCRIHDFRSFCICLRRVSLLIIEEVVITD
jgi:hypothetical protein